MKSPEARPGSLENTLDASITWRYLAPTGHTLETCMRPDYWRNAIRELTQSRVAGRHAWNRIEILAEDGTWEAELRVIAVQGEFVTTRVLREWTAPKAKKVDLPQGWKSEHVPGNGWRVMDNNGKPLVSGEPTEDEALRKALALRKAA